jgi:hypothetical protein
MTNEQRSAFELAFNRWFLGNPGAVRACLDLLEVSHLWDDVVDQDKPVDPETANRAMRKAMIDLPSNPFWSANLGMLTPVMQLAYMQWRAANELEKSVVTADLQKAYMLRASLYSVFHYVAALCGGIDHADKIGPEIYRLYGETFDTFREEQDA